MRTLAFALISLVAAGCVAPGADEAPSGPNQLQGDDKADGGGPLWAGLTSVTLERYATDPCDDGAHALGDAPIVYDDWVRQRAGVRNVCFEVWSPGVTDTDNPDYWKDLDVQVHYRFGTGAWQMAYVPSIGRRGNNRRYAWSIDYALDPIANAGSLVAVGAPLQILSESNGWAMVAKEMEVSFTVNGRTLGAPSGRSFTVRYEGQAREPSLAANAAGYVLHDIVACDGMHVGWGAGYFAVDVRDQAAVTALGSGLDGSAIYGTPTARSATGSGPIVSTVFSSETQDPGEVLPSFRDAGGTRLEPHGTSMSLAFDVYDRASGQVRTLTSTFTGCTAAAE